MSCLSCAHGAEGEQAHPVAFEHVSDSKTTLTKLTLGRNLAPVAADLDGDGVAELYVGTHGKRMVRLNQAAQAPYRFSNSGSTANPLDAVTMSYENDTPFVALADVDGDGDDDVAWFDFKPVEGSITSVYLNTMVYLENVGTPEAPDFQMVEGDANPFTGISSEWQGTPAFGDFDGDGDVDLVFGDRDGSFRYCRNLLAEEGIALFAEMMGSLNPFWGMDVGEHSSPVVVDLDGDGDLDVVSGEMRGGLHWLENTTVSGGPLSFELKDPADTPFGDFATGIASMPAVLDIDGDTDLDLVVGNSEGSLSLLANQRLRPEGNSLLASGHDSPSLSRAKAPVKGDLNGDDIADLADAFLALKTLAEALTGALGPGIAQGGTFPRGNSHGSVQGQGRG